MSREDLRGRWSLLFFGFANCPHICPDTLYTLARAHQVLAQAGLDEHCQVIFVSVDPDRDTPARLADYIAQFNPEFRAFTGGHEEPSALTRQLGIAYELRPRDVASQDYDVVHSTSVVVIDPSVRLRGAFTPPHDSSRMARELQTLIGGSDH